MEVWPVGQTDLALDAAGMPLYHASKCTGQARTISGGSSSYANEAALSIQRLPIPGGGTQCPLARRGMGNN